MRVAFITPEFITEYSDGGGLGNYLFRTAKLLVSNGHEAEVFVLSMQEPRVFMYHGIRVERVSPVTRRLWSKILTKALILSRLIESCATMSRLIGQSLALADAMERRHQVEPFHIIQSADFLSVGVAVRATNDRVHVIRCSTAADLYNQVDGDLHRVSWWRAWLERTSLRRADKVYAPSSLVASHYKEKYGINVSVIRPPISIEVSPMSAITFELPDRYLIHFGQLIRRKGTMWLVESLKYAFQLDPSLQMVWVGSGNTAELESLLASLGPFQENIRWLGRFQKPELYALLQRSEGAVLPSLVDNLPNTAIECLMFGIPIIGTRGASIDELVEDGVTGELVTVNDVEGLAHAILRVWQGHSSIRKGFTWTSMVAEEMKPSNAIENLLKFATGIDPT